MTAANRAGADIPAWREAGAQALVWIGAVGGVLTIVVGWSNVVAPAEWLRWATDGFSRTMSALFGLAARPFGTGVSNDGVLTLSFLLFYLMLTAGSLLLERDDDGYIPKIQNFMRLLIVSYIVWPAIFLLSFAMRLATFTDKSFTMIVFLCSVALCHILINSLVRIDIEILGLILLFLLANLSALDVIREAIYGASFSVAGGYRRAILEIVLTLALVMAMLFPAVLAPGSVFRKSIGTIVLSAAIILATSAAWQFDYTKLSLSNYFHCCELRAPWPDPVPNPSSS
jgi:hypothetical protein